jgi:Family of unknown function (DUF5362)
MEPANNNLFDLQIDETASGYLAETAKWGKFLAIMGFIFCGLLLLVGLLMGSTMGALFATSGLGGSTGIIFSVVYVAIAALYLMPCIYLYKFAKSMQTALKGGDTIQLHEGLKNLKSCFKFMGILTIVFLAIYALAFVVGGLAAAFMR